MAPHTCGKYIINYYDEVVIMSARFCVQSGLVKSILWGSMGEEWHRNNYGTCGKNNYVRFCVWFLWGWRKMTSYGNINGATYTYVHVEMKLCIIMWGYVPVRNDRSTVDGFLLLITMLPLCRGINAVKVCTNCIWCVHRWYYESYVAG
jgi:hypothetical protein